MLASLTTDDIVSAIQAQNVQVAAGRFGAEPAPPGTELQLTINTEGRLITPDQFGQIIVKRGDNGEIVYLADVSRVELGAKDYNVSSYLDGKPAVGAGYLSIARLQRGEDRPRSQSHDEGAVPVFSGRLEIYHRLRSDSVHRAIGRSCYPYTLRSCCCWC